jgi:hypothetical protein
MPIDRPIAIGKNLPVADCIQNGTVNTHTGNLGEYWGYLATKKKLSADLQNPFAGPHIARQTGKAARAERHNWMPGLEQGYFESPLYAGCASIHRRAKPGDEIHRDAFFGCRCSRERSARGKTKPGSARIRIKGRALPKCAGRVA